MRIGICDDDQDFTACLCGMIRELAPKDRTIVFHSGFALLEYLEREPHGMDTLFLDMEMPHLNGLDTARELRQSNPLMSIIVVTDHSQFALPCYEISPINFLLKPIKRDVLANCLERARTLAQEDYLLLQPKGGMIYLPLSQIASIVSSRFRVQFTLLGGEDYSVYQAMEHYEALLTGKGFFRIHRHTIVNLQAVATVEVDGRVTLTNGKIVTVAQRRKTDLMAALIKWRKAYV